MKSWSRARHGMAVFLIFCLPALFVFTIARCHSSPDALLDPDEVQIRIRNASIVELESVVVEFPEETETYGDIAPGRTTSYRTVRRAYRYADVETRVEGREVVLQPVDYVGESLLGPGRYTYEIQVDPSGDYLFLGLVED